MIKSFSPKTCAFDAEWAPCPDTARVLLDLLDDTPEREAVDAVWAKYATEEKPRPFLKLALCKVVSIAAVLRTRERNGNVALTLTTRSVAEVGEAELIGEFLEKVAGGKYQLWGFNSADSDLLILKQRAIALGQACPCFSQRPDKPWTGLDYHDSRHSEGHIDMLKLIGGYGRGMAFPTLDEYAAACRIPGKLDVCGDDVAELYLSGQIEQIAEYNATDAVTTHLLMLQIARHGGHLSASEYAGEVVAVRQLVEGEIEKGQTQFEKFLGVWERRQGDQWVRDGYGAGSDAKLAMGGGAGRGDVVCTETVRAAWPEIMACVRERCGHQLQAALKAVKDMTLADGRLVLSFGNNQFSHDFVTEKRDQVAAVIGQVLDVAGLEIECQMGERAGERVQG